MSPFIVIKNSPVRRLAAIAVAALATATAGVSRGDDAVKPDMGGDAKKATDNPTPGYLPGYRQAMGLGLSP